MSSSIAIDSPSVKGANMRLFTLYEDFDAGFRAKLLADRILDRVGSSRQISRAMWRIGSTKPIGRIHQMMARDAAESDVLLVACSAVDQTQQTVIRWLYSLLGWRSNPMLPGLLIGLFGDREHGASASDWLLSHLTAFAARNHLEFIWHSESAGVTDPHWIEQVLERFPGQNFNSHKAIYPTVAIT